MPPLHSLSNWLQTNKELMDNHFEAHFIMDLVLKYSAVIVVAYP